MYRIAAFTISFAAVYQISIATDGTTMRRQTPKQNGGAHWYVDSSGDNHLMPLLVGLEDHFQSVAPSHEKLNESSRQQLEKITVYAGEDGPWSGFHGFERGMYACGVKVRWQTLRDRRRKYGDDTGCNSLKLKYCHYDNWIRQSEWKGKENGRWGKKRDEFMCPQNYWITGISVANSKARFEKKKKFFAHSWRGNIWKKVPKNKIVKWGWWLPDKLGIVGVKIRCSQKNASMDTDIVETRDYAKRLRVNSVFTDFPAATNKWVRDFEIRMQKKQGGARRRKYLLNDDIAWNGLRLEIEEPSDGMSTKGVTGYWKLLGSGHGYTYTISEGVSKSDSTELTKEDSVSITASVEAGFDFAKVSVAREWATMTSRAMGRTFEKSVSNTKEFSCPSLSTYPYMWQWVFTKAKDDYGRPGWTVQSPHIRCTANYRSPQCPYIFCAGNDSSCQTCTSYEWMPGNH